MKKVGMLLLKLLLSFTLIIIIILAIFIRGDLELDHLIDKYTDSSSQFWEIKGIPFHVKIKGEGTPIILLHGSFSSLHTWEAWEEALSKKYKTISIDLPGHGLTGPDISLRYSSEDYAQLVFFLADQLKLEKFHIAGNSMGGGVGLVMASTHPERILSLNLINASGAPKDILTVKNNQRPWIFKVAENPFLASILLKCTPRFLFKMNLKQVFDDDSKISDELIDRYYELIRREGNRKATLDRLQNRKSFSVDFEKLNMPVLIMWGKNDKWISVKNAHLFSKVIPNAKLVIFEKVGHVPMEEIPTQSVAEYLEFLGSTNE